jgi:hypothetical protein
MKIILSIVKTEMLKRLFVVLSIFTTVSGCKTTGTPGSQDSVTTSQITGNNCYYVGLFNQSSINYNTLGDAIYSAVAEIDDLKTCFRSQRHLPDNLYVLDGHTTQAVGNNLYVRRGAGSYEIAREINKIVWRKGWSGAIKGAVYPKACHDNKWVCETPNNNVCANFTSGSFSSLSKVEVSGGGSWRARLTGGLADYVRLGRETSWIHTQNGDILDIHCLFQGEF